jgi:hypothetical protein
LAADTARSSPLDAHERGAGVGQHHLDVGEVGVDQPWCRDQVRDAGHTLKEHLVGHLERVEHAGLVVRDRQQPVVRDHDERVDLLLETLHAVVGLHRPTAALEPERAGDHADRQCAGGTGHLGDHGGSAGAGAAALTRGDEHHVGALHHLVDLVVVGFSGRASDLGIAAGAETAGEVATDVELDVGVAHEERLGIGVDRDELDTLQPRIDHPVDRVDAAAADTDDLDHSEIVGGCGGHQ